MCHLANISYRLGRQVPFGKQYDAMGENEHVAASIRAIEEQLKGVLGMNLSKATYQLGAKLRFDPKTEKFLDNPEADKLLSGSYREPFVVREHGVTFWGGKEWIGGWAAPDCHSPRRAIE